jgi:hypothetical protein
VSGSYALPAEPRDPYLGAGLWGRRDLVVLVMLYLIGAIGLVVAWRGSAAEANWRDDAKWLVTATGGVSLAGLGLMVWLVAGKLRIAAAQRAVRRGLVERREERSVSAVVPVAETVTAPAMRRYHRPTCLLMVGKAAVAADPALLKPCGVCEP